MFIRLCVALFMLLITGTTYANIIFPFMLVFEHIHYIFGWSLIVASLIAEFICLYWVLRKQASLVKIILTTVIMNTVSAVVGLYFMMFADIGLLSILGIMPQFMQDAIRTRQEVIYYVCLYCIIVTVNSCIEYIIARLFFTQANPKTLAYIIIIANAVSVAIGLAGLGLYRYYGWWLPGIR